MNRRAYRQRIEEIEQKYEPRYALFGRWMADAKRAALAAGLSSLSEVTTLPPYQRGEGLNTAIAILRHAPDYRSAIQRLSEQVAEPSGSPYFAEAVQLVLDDLQAERVEPMPLSALFEAPASA